MSTLLILFTKKMKGIESQLMWKIKAQTEQFCLSWNIIANVISFVLETKKSKNVTIYKWVCSSELFPIFSASSMVSGSFWPRVSGNVKAKSPEINAKLPNTSNGKKL